ncbi:hypothetical protein C8B47_21995, partial [filamentous cyanobacterium CCP4]
DVYKRQTKLSLTHLTCRHNSMGETSLVPMLYVGIPRWCSSARGGKTQERCWHHQIDLVIA